MHEHHNWLMGAPVTVALLLLALDYIRGWFRLRNMSTEAVPLWRMAAFLAGLSAVWIAIGSPIASLDRELLSMHMIQHLLLMTIGAPLILLGTPMLPLMHGFARSFDRRLLFFPWRVVEDVRGLIVHPLFCWLFAAAVLIGWHIPAIYELALESEALHHVEHASFLAAGLLFWRPVIPSSGRSLRPPRWSIVLYLFAATLPCDVLSAYLAFCERVIYGSYLNAPSRFGISPLQDQTFAGALMWVCVTFAYLVPAAVITIRLLSQPDPQDRMQRSPRLRTV
jgi:cytochrome c oxidase assembly factor CtaG